MHALTHMHAHICTHTHTYTHTRVHMYVCTHVGMNTRMHTCVLPLTHTHTHTHTHTLLFPMLSHSQVKSRQERVAHIYNALSTVLNTFVYCQPGLQQHQTPLNIVAIIMQKTTTVGGMEMVCMCCTHESITFCSLSEVEMLISASELYMLERNLL